MIRHQEFHATLQDSATGYYLEFRLYTTQSNKEIHILIGLLRSLLRDVLSSRKIVLSSLELFNGMKFHYLGLIKITRGFL